MKVLSRFLLVFLFSLASVSHATGQGVRRIPPSRPSEKGKVIAFVSYLYERGDLQGHNARKIGEGSFKIGDCMDCIRGLRLADAANVRFSGGSASKLKLSREGNVKFENCSVDTFQLATGDFVCSFVQDKKFHRYFFMFQPQTP